MNSNEDQMIAQLERELLSLAPLPPDPALLLRLERTMHDPVLDRAPAAAKVIPFRKPQPAAMEHNQPNWKPWAAVAACAAVATGAVTWKHGQIQAQNALAASPKFISSPVQSQLQRVQQGNLILDPKGGLMRQMRLEINNQQHFEDRVNGALLEIRYPTTQEILVVEPVQ